MNPVIYLFLAIGGFTLAGGIFNWDWFMNNRKAQRVVRLFSRTGARVFYIILGALIITLGILGAMGIVQIK